MDRRRGRRVGESLRGLEESSTHLPMCTVKAVAELDFGRGQSSRKLAVFTQVCQLSKQISSLGANRLSM